MGGEQSQEVEMSIPGSLRPLNAFLSDAYKVWRESETREGLYNDAEVISLKKLSVSHIQQAFRLLPVLDISTDDKGIACLESFQKLYAKLCAELKITTKLDDGTKSPGVTYQLHQQRFAEADALLSIAEYQTNEGFTFEGTLNYHIASIFYCIINSAVASSDNNKFIHQRLVYAAWRTRQFSNYRTNLTLEHYLGSSCSSAYSIDSNAKLGKGSYGSVYLAHHRKTHIAHAVKVLNVDHATAYYLRKLQMEISLLKEIDHPNIVNLKEVYFGRRTVYLVTSLCRGGEIFNLLHAGKSKGYLFREERAAKLILDMFSAVHYLHCQGIVHRDLKLENFLFEEKNSTSALILIDFGLSRRFDAEEVMTQRVGSCYCMAPEILAGAYDYRCDIWSLGVLSYMIISGTPPFSGKTVDLVYEATRTQEATFPENKFKHVSSTCIDFMRRLLVKNPLKRMTSAEALEHPFLMKARQTQQEANAESDNSRGMVPEADIGQVPVERPLAMVFNPVQAESIMQSTIAYMEATPMVKLFLSVVSTLLSTDEIRGFREKFYFLDTRREGVITLASFYNNLMCAPSVLCGDIDLYAAFDAIAVSMSMRHSSGITYREFVSAAMCGKIFFPDVRVQEAFDLLDIDKAGVITVDTLRKLLGDDFSEAEMIDIVNNGDPHSNGKLYFDTVLAQWKDFEKRSRAITNLPNSEERSTHSTLQGTDSEAGSYMSNSEDSVFPETNEDSMEVDN